MTLIIVVIEWLGFAVCHQIPERSFSYGGQIIALCARDTGIYMGLLVGFIFLSIINRKHEYGFPPWWAILVGVIGIGLMGLDGLTSYGGFRTTTNEIRLITGALAGTALPMVLVPMFNYQAWKEGSEERVIKDGWHFAAYMCSALLTVLLFQFRPGWLFWPMFVITGFSVAFAFVYVNMILVMLLPWFARKAERVRQLIVPALIGGVMGFAELMAAYYMHWFLLQQILASR